VKLKADPSVEADRKTKPEEKMNQEVKASGKG
jgi:hypothetical protein